MTRLSYMLLTAALAFGAPAPARAHGPGPGEVTGVSVQPQAGRTEIAIAVRGAVEVRDFTLQSPDRLVLDLVGAQLGANGGYDGVKRGGVVNVRYSQFKSNIVRVVIELDGTKAYKVTRSDSVVRVSFEANSDFTAWSSAVASAPAPAAAEEPVAVQEPVVQPSPALRRASAFATPAPVRPKKEDNISVTWDRASIADVVAGFAEFSHRTIILGKDVKGEVTAEIKDQPWHMAFQAILAAHGLSVQEMPGGILRVDAPTALAALDSLEPLETRVVKINYGDAGSLAKTVETMLTKGRGRVAVDTATKTLILTDTRSRVPEIADFVGSLDIKTPQLSIQAKIIFVDRTDIEQLGVKYDIGNPVQFFNQVVQRNDPANPGEQFKKEVNIVDLGGNSLAAVGNATSQITGSAIDLLYSTAIGNFSLTTFLSALEKSELSDVQAEPTITTLDNREADILVGEETPVRVVDASAQSAGGGPRATVQFKETGIRLTVTPHVTNNRQIMLQLHTERSALQLLASTDLGYNFPKQRTDNQLLVNDGETVVIGGLTITEVLRNRTGIPLLSGLPVVGKLFAFSSNQERRRDLVILVTPRIIDDNP